MTIGKELTPKLQKLVLRVEDDLRTRLEDDSERKARWQAEHAAALKADRTSSAWVAWRDDRVTQAAVGWVLTTVFLRFCEDNALLSKVWISGPGKRRQEALDAENAYFRSNPENTWREWIVEGVNHLDSFPATRGLVDKHAALWQVSPSGVMAKEILDFWRATDESGVPAYDFQDEELSTRFLGDLYQDLSEYAKKTFALLQTPEFVEEFILDQTLSPALAERPLEGFKLIDPTCGSGHFLLGGFQRLLDAWSIKAPNLEIRQRVQKSLDGIHGVDLNPFAVAVARFRLTIAALQATGELDLERAPDFSFHLAAGDSLLHGHAQREFQFEGFDADAEISGFAYATEDLEQLKRILRPGQYDLVVGNPPYITVKDKTLKKRYRELYRSIGGQLMLTVPFMERFFGLALSESNLRPAGWVGQITSNSFMKRESGSKLIEEFLPTVDLTHVIDSEGAWIPGHNSDGTPTVILIGRNQRPVRSQVRAVLSKGRREQRSDASEGLGPYWISIADHVSDLGFENDWISIADLPRELLSKHPWSLSGGGIGELLDVLMKASITSVGKISKRVGLFGDSHADEVFFMPHNFARRIGLPAENLSNATRGATVRDWLADYSETAFIPSSSVGSMDESSVLGLAIKTFWPLRTSLWSRSVFGGDTYRMAGRSWLAWHQLPEDKGTSHMAITFAEVATHNHFVLSRGGEVFNRTAPIIKLPDTSNETDQLALLGLLNSSTTCFWLKQKCQPKGGAAGISWMRTYQFNGANVKDIPVPAVLPLARAVKIESLARAAKSLMPSSVVSSQEPTATLLETARREYESIVRQMLSEQEELDWEVYASFGLVDDGLVYTGDDLPALNLGQRAFEMDLALKMAEGQPDSEWFSRNGSMPITELPGGWPDEYRNLVQRRKGEIARNANMRLLESPNYKRRWAGESWEVLQKRALESWLLDKLGDQAFWFDAHGRPLARSVSQLADAVSRTPDLVSVLALWESTLDVDVTRALTRLLEVEAVPYLGAQRLTEQGLRKHEAWVEIWALQEKEDDGEDVGRTTAPPPYEPSDFQRSSWWQARGKLDLQKERFISYLDAGRSTDPTLLLGWAGWDHAQQFLVLATLMDERIGEGIDDAMLTPLVAGMAELLPWVKQWNSDMDPAFGMSMADFCAAQLEERMTQLNLSTDDLKAWRPTVSTRGRRVLKEKA
ncbi:BREX-2 system adenine-specific DNA-methyltransferase PglX [Arthrobacter wenxiniae]|uniref:site-specific DNA-methyltransferase (adenine-specific) n=1 Tax=Arthrobacter wenxiniae TaxID=2713570 RepID=A0A7Y7LZN0_9MICC|nr:BREX-2 system adenine-specific DNA-methyltransferase PglX [Arthrobacter wenxiniae]NVM96157.1 BREX-2 system adenine-specific DNA-methyltransferase PglX [Arthrobacter wenxiniae]